MIRSKGYSTRHKRRKIKATVDKEIADLQEPHINLEQAANFSRNIHLNSENYNRTTEIHQENRKLNSSPVGHDSDKINNIPNNLQDSSNVSSDENIFNCFDSSSSESETSTPLANTEEFVPRNISEDLRKWGLQFNITHNALDSLLKILQPIHQTLPKCARTLLQTPKSVIPRNVDSGQYIHMGIKSFLEKRVEQPLNLCSAEVITIWIKFSIDGMSLFKNSTNNNMWPILAQLPIGNKIPYPIGIYLGGTKPESLENFLCEFVEDLRTLSETPFQINTQRYILDAQKCIFICDAPARAFVKGIKGHNSKYGCEKCEVRGKWDRKTYFESINSPLRNKQSFQIRRQDEHHQQKYIETPTPLETLGIDMIHQFPIDYMHLICVGIVRKMVRLWQSGPLKVRQRTRIISNISEKLLSCHKFVPSDFNRKTRELKYSDRWKATESRLFVMYLGPIILSKYLPSHIFKHFMLLSCGMLIITTTQTDKYELANECFEIFVKYFGQYYGKENVTYNVHSLVHLVLDVKYHGNVDNFSAFPFENYLGTLQRRIRAPHHSLQQICARLVEQEYLPSRKACIFPNPTSTSKYAKTYHFDSFKLRTNCKDSFFRTTQNFVQLVDIIVEGDQSVVLKGNILSNLGNYFEYPVPSTILDIVKVKPSSSFQIFGPEDVVAKCMCIKCDSDMMYALVEFGSEGKNGESKPCGIIPFKWISPDTTKCKYPRKNVKAAINNQAAPQPGWKDCEIKLVYFCENRQKIEHKQQKYLDTSNVDTFDEEIEEYHNTMKLRPRERSLNDVSHTNFTFAPITEDVESPSPPESRHENMEIDPPFPSQMSSIQHNVGVDQSSSLGIPPIHSPPPGDSCHNHQIANSQNRSGFEYLVLKKLAQIANELKDLSLEVRELKSGGTVAYSDLRMTGIPHFPLKSTEELNMFNAKCEQSEEILLKVITSCRRIGGNDLKNSTERVLCMLMTNSLATEYNWIGKRFTNRPRKIAITSTLIPKIVKQAVMKDGDLEFTEHAIEEVIKAWFRNAKSRVK